MRSLQHMCVLLLTVVVGLAACVQTPTKKPVDNTKKAEINTQLGIEYLTRRDYESALEKLQKALKQDSGYAPAHDAIAILYEQLGEVDKADRHYKRALSLDSKNSSSLNNYGQFLCRNKQPDKAESYFLRALKDPLYRYPAMVYTNAGICAGKVPDLRKSETYFRKALDADKTYVPALRQMIRLNYEQDNYLGTRAYLQRYEEQGSLTAELLLIAVRTENQLGDKTAASKYAFLLKNKFPESAQANQLRKWEDDKSN